MASVRWHQFVQPYEPRELDPDPFYDLADRAAPQRVALIGDAAKASCSIPLERRAPGIFMERSPYNGNR